jgi:hypothetical protein
MEGLWLLVLLGCPLMMLVMMLLMWRGMRRHDRDEGEP